MTDEKKYSLASLSDQEKREIHSRLVKAARKIGTELETIGQARDQAAVLDALEQNIAQTGFTDHHQDNRFDRRSYEIARRVVINDVFLNYDVPFSRRWEHVREIERQPGTDLMLVCGPIDGNTNFLDSLEYQLDQERRQITVGKTSPDACVCLAMVDVNVPFKPIATAIYWFRNREVMSSLVAGDSYLAFRGVGNALVDQEEELDRMRRKKSNIFWNIFIADFVNQFRKGPTALEESLIDYGWERKRTIIPVRGSPATSSYLCAIIEPKSVIAYVDGRADWCLPQDVTDERKRRPYAFLKYMNAISVLPIVLGYGLEARAIDGRPLDEAHPIDAETLLSKDKSTDMTLVVGLPEFFKPESDFNIIDGLRKGRELARQEWSRYIGAPTTLEKQP